MLFAGLQRQHPAAFAVAIHSLSDQSTGDFANVFLPTGHDSQIRSAITHRCAQALSFGNGDVGLILSGTFQDTQTDRIETDDRQSAFLVNNVGYRVISSRCPKKLGCWVTTQIVCIVDCFREIIRVEEAVRCWQSHDPNIQIGHVG